LLFVFVVIEQIDLLNETQQSQWNQNEILSRNAKLVGEWEKEEKKISFLFTNGIDKSIFDAMKDERGIERKKERNFLLSVVNATTIFYSHSQSNEKSRRSCLAYSSCRNNHLSHSLTFQHWLSFWNWKSSTVHVLTENFSWLNLFFFLLYILFPPFVLYLHWFKVCWVLGIYAWLGKHYVAQSWKKVFFLRSSILVKKKQLKVRASNKLNWQSLWGTKNKI
jgi:hypothetical protein